VRSRRRRRCPSCRLETRIRGLAHSRELVLAGLAGHLARRVRENGVSGITDARGCAGPGSRDHRDRRNGYGQRSRCDEYFLHGLAFCWVAARLPLPDECRIMWRESQRFPVTRIDFYLPIRDTVPILLHHNASQDDSMAYASRVCIEYACATIPLHTHGGARDPQSKPALATLRGPSSRWQIPRSMPIRGETPFWLVRPIQTACAATHLRSV